MLQKINSKIEKLGKFQEAVLVIILSSLLVFLVTIGLGTITSGYHLVDDHEFLEYFYNMKFEGKSVLGLIKAWIVKDLSWRYEPLYYMNRILSCAVFGINLTGYSVLKSLEIIISCIFLYYCGRLMGGEKGIFLFICSNSSDGISVCCMVETRTSGSTVYTSFFYWFLLHAEMAY